MPKITLKIDDFKALASDSRLDILKALDNRQMNLKELSKETDLHKMTLHEHLSKLVDAGYVKRLEREGHKWVYYKITWKGKGLLHPGTTKVIVLFTSTFISIIIAITSFIKYIQSYSVDFIPVVPLDRGTPYTYKEVISQDTNFYYIAIFCFIVFFVLLVLSIIYFRHYKKAKNLREKL